MESAVQIAVEMSKIVPTMIRHMYPYVFATIDLPPSQVIAISTIYEIGECRLGELSKQMHISAPTVTGIIDRLEESGYVKRTPDAEDRRAIKIHLTPAGKKVAVQFRENIKNRWHLILAKLPPQEQMNILNTVTKITKGFIDETNH